MNAKAAVLYQSQIRRRTSARRAWLAETGLPMATSESRFLSAAWDPTTVHKKMAETMGAILMESFMMAGNSEEEVVWYFVSRR
jgi:hypothetical protein